MRAAHEQSAAAGTPSAAHSGLRRWLSRGALGWAVLFYAALAVASGWAYSTLRIRTDRVQTLRLEDDRLRSVAIALRSGVAAMLDDAVGAAVAGVNELASSGSVQAVGDRDLVLTLQKMLTRGEWVRSLFLITDSRFARAGRSGASETRHDLPAGFPGSDLPVEADTWVGKPLPDPDHPGVLVVPVARRLHLGQGQSVWAGALMDFQRVETLHSQVGRPASTLGLITTGGVVLLIAGPAAGADAHLLPGGDVSSSPLFQRAPRTSEAGVVKGFAPRLGIEMVFAYARVGDYPITTVVGEPLRTLLAPWRERTRDTLIVTAASSVFVLLLTALVMQHLARRRRAEQSLLESEERYRSLVEALPEAVYVHRGGAVLFANSAALELVGAASLDELAGRSVLSFAVESDREALAERIQRMLDTGVAARPVETQARRLDGSLVWVEVEGVPIEFAGARAVQSVLHDITARRLREHTEAERDRRLERQAAALVSLASREPGGSGDPRGALRVIGSRAAEVLEVDRGAVWLLDAEETQLRCVDLYETALRCHMQGFSVDTGRIPVYLAALRAERVVIATPDLPDDPRLRELMQLEFPTPPARSLIAAPVRSSGRLAGAVVFEALSVARVWQEDEVNFAGGIADQVARTLLDAQREQVLAELRVLAGELMRSQDEERRRIGRELHDSTGQTLTALELDLARLERSSASLTGEERYLLAHCAELARQCSTEIRTASYLLHPPLLDERGLGSALRWLADGVRSRGGIEVRLDLPESIPRLPPEEELALFRVAQEMLTNVLRHAASPWVAIRLLTGPDSLVLEVEDAGRGVAPAPPRAADGGPVPGVGLAGMRERLRQVGGAFELASTPQGTRVRATLPLRPLADRRSA